MRKHLLVLAILLIIACGVPDAVGGTSASTTASPPNTSTTVDPDQSVDSDGDEPIVEPGPVGSIPVPRPPIVGSIDAEVSITGADLRIMESYPIQVTVQVTGDKPTPCHEVFWTVEDDGEVIDIVMISQIAGDQTCAQVIEPFVIAVPLGSWADERREVFLNGELVGSFES
ncbi:MAG TPA: hypothetical protein VIH55_04215 [Acidimicrobiia bacterium]